MIWLIGKNGLLGSAVLRELKKQNLPHISTGREIDITSIESLNNFVANCTEKITHIINCAGYTNVDKAESDIEAAKELNINGPENITKIANKINATVIHISTDYVFDGKIKSPISENTKTCPLQVYGKTKAAGDKIITAKADKFYILRTAWLYGFNHKNFVTTMINAMNTKKYISVVNDQTGSPTFAEDIANVIVKIIVKEKKETPIPYGIYNYTNEGITSWYDFAKEIKNQATKLGLIKNEKCTLSSCSSSDYNAPAKRPAYSVLNKEKIKNTLNIEIPEWKESLSIFLKSLSEN